MKTAINDGKGNIFFCQLGLKRCGIVPIDGSVGPVMFSGQLVSSHADGAYTFVGKTLYLFGGREGEIESIAFLFTELRQPGRNT